MRKADPKAGPLAWCGVVWDAAGRGGQRRPGRAWHGLAGHNGDETSTRVNTVPNEKGRLVSRPLCIGYQYGSVL
jgi:hypothetical protein